MPRIKLGEEGSSQYFKFKIGDKVRSKLGATDGEIVSGDYFPDLKPPILIFYIVKFKSPNSMCTYTQDDIELEPIIPDTPPVRRLARSGRYTIPKKSI